MLPSELIDHRKRIDHHGVLIPVRIVSRPCVYKQKNSVVKPHCFFVRFLRLIADEGQKSCLASTLDSDIDLSLVLCASAGDAARMNLASLADELAQSLGVLIINVSDLVCAENANLLSLIAIEGARGTSGVLGSIHLNPPVVVSRLIQ